MVDIRMSNCVYIQQRNLSHAGLIQLVEKLEGRLPEGATVIKVLHRYSYEQISSIVEHEYEFIRYKTLASSSFLAYLTFNKYVLDTSLYRELVRMMDERMQVSRMTQTNCLEKDSIVNCDETWCYEDGSRGRDVLRHILGESQLKVLQPGGYNVYMYLDDKLIDTEHFAV